MSTRHTRDVHVTQFNQIPLSLSPSPRARAHTHTHAIRQHKHHTLSYWWTFFVWSWRFCQVVGPWSASVYNLMCAVHTFVCTFGCVCARALKRRCVCQCKRTRTEVNVSFRTCAGVKFARFVCVCVRTYVSGCCERARERRCVHVSLYVRVWGGGGGGEGRDALLRCEVVCIPGRYVCVRVRGYVFHDYVRHWWPIDKRTLDLAVRCACAQAREHGGLLAPRQSHGHLWRKDEWRHIGEKMYG